MVTYLVELEGMAVLAAEVQVNLLMVEQEMFQVHLLLKEMLAVIILLLEQVVLEAEVSAEVVHQTVVITVVMAAAELQILFQVEQ